MRKILLFMVIPFGITAQVGINTPTPASTLDITAKNLTGTATAVDGIIIPRVDRQRAQSMTGTPVSTMIYVNNIATGTQTGTAININAIGFYYFNGTVWTKIASEADIINIYNNDGSLTGNRTVTQGNSTLAFTGTSTNAFSVDGATLSVDAANDRIGIGTATPTTKVEIASGTANVSGLKFTNINNATPSTSNTSPLGIDASGNVVVQSTLSTSFRSFSIDANTPTNSTVTLGSLEFRYPSTTCTNADSFVQVRSTTGVNNIGILHGIYRTAQNASTFVNTIPVTVTPTFTNLSSAAVNCVQDGSAQFNFFSYTDRTFYRVSFHIADGDSMGFGALGYIFAELQK